VPWRGPRVPGEIPTLGPVVLDWMIENLAAPDRSEYEAFYPTREQAQFLYDFYAISPATGKRLYRRAVYSRPKGSGKSPFLGAIAAAEALAPVVPDGWDADGEPVGKPWAALRTPWVQIAAVSEDQTQNAYAPLLEMLRGGPAIHNYPGLDPMQSFIALPTGRIEFVTSAATSREGNRPIFAILDQTEEWKVPNGGVRLAQTIRRNLGKTSGSSIEAPNAYVPGLDSVAEGSAEYAAAIREGRVRESGLLWDHREAPADTDLEDVDSLRAGLIYAYGDSATEAGGWVDIDRIMAEIWDPSTPPETARQFYLNQITAASDSWLSQPEWAGCADASKVIADRDTIVLGFDGSRKRVHSTTDATALMGVRVSDGHLFTVGVWEEPQGAAGRDWEVPTSVVDATIREAFRRWHVIGLYADPARWEGFVSAWEAEFNPKLKIKVSAAHPCEWWMTGGRASQMVRALEEFNNAVVHREMTHDGSGVLTRHVLNARRRMGRAGMQIAKEFPESPHKIDAAVAAVLAWRARLDAIAAGFGGPEVRRYAPKRIR
jgi:phage terminase large subunit-like protein